MLPVSGALQLNTSGARCDLPVSSAMYAYSTVVRPWPPSCSVRKKFHSPSERALRLQSLEDLDLPRREGPAVAAVDLRQELVLQRQDPGVDEAFHLVEDGSQPRADADVHGRALLLCVPFAALSNR